MTNENSGGGSTNGMLYFLVGALCVAVAVGGFFMFHGGGSSVAQAPAAATAAPAPTETKNITIERKTTIETPKVIERTERR